MKTFPLSKELYAHFKNTITKIPNVFLEQLKYN